MRAAPLVFSREAIRRVDGAARDEFGIPTIVLMENAAMALERACAPLLGAGAGLALVLCGPGNNGGDGLALARRLDNAGHRVVVALAASAARYAGDARTNLCIVERMGLPLADVSAHDARSGLDALVRRYAPGGSVALLVDALLGTGSTRAPEEPIASVIAWINATRRASARARVLAVDIPSGLDCDTGLPLAPGNAERATVRADVTVTFAGLKRGFLDPRSREFTGEVVVGDIGAPRALLERFADPPK